MDYLSQNKIQAKIQADGHFSGRYLRFSESPSLWPPKSRILDGSELEVTEQQATLRPTLELFLKTQLCFVRKYNRYFKLLVIVFLTIRWVAAHLSGYLIGDEPWQWPFLCTAHLWYVPVPTGYLLRLWRIGSLWIQL